MASAFTLLPMSQELSLTAGEIFEGKITVSNPADATEDFSYLVEVSPYSVSGGEYLADLETKNNHTLLADWIEVEKPSGILKPNESVNIKYKITVPLKAPAGGQYAAISVRSNNQTSSTVSAHIENIFQMASVIFANVSGETVHSGEIVSNTMPAFSTVTPVFSKISLTNGGNVHEKATTTITVKNVFGGGQVFPLEGEQNSFVDYVMPESSRYITRSIDRLAGLGVYEVNQTVEYLGETSSLSQIVIVCPIWFLVLVMATIAALIVTVVTMVRKRIKLKREI